MNIWLRDILACPQDGRELELDGDHLICPVDHRYLVVDDIPVMLFDDRNPTHHYITKSLEKVARIEAGVPVEEIVELKTNRIGEIDNFVKAELPYTCGNLYFAIQNDLTRYPFPELRLPAGENRTLLDVGCSWGRWTIPAAQNGYRAVGIDPNLDAVLAARRVSRQVGVEPAFVVADARFLPFAANSIDTTFSYSVIQHLTKANARISLSEMSRVTKPDGRVLVQMPNKYGIRCLYHQLRMGFKDGKEGCDVFYWSPRDLVETFTDEIGKTDVTVDCFFGLNVQKSDVDILPFTHKIIVKSSEFFRRASEVFPFLGNAADSLYLSSVNQKPERPS